MKREEILTAIFEDMRMMHRLHASPHSSEKKELKGMPTRSQMGIMMILSQGEVKTVKELAETFCMSSSAATQLVEGLVQAKLMARKEDKEDRRKLNLTLTALGKKKLEEAKKERFAGLKKLFEPLDDQELMQLKKLQSKIIANLQ